jgi:hypothetical protein
MVDCDGRSVGALEIAQRLKDAQAELSFEISADATVESAAGVGSNIKSVGAGSARVDFFRATGGVAGAGSQPLPHAAWVLVRCLASGGGVPERGFATGTDATSQFEDDDRYGFTEGLA